ncbi:MAG: hypothetical protein QGF46_07095 [Planctomycetota bacterium]|nr:hypothetical protein [Planctomycetota bacterium]
MSLSRLPLALIVVWSTAACGILFPGPSLPDYDEVVAAKSDQAREWELLEFCYDALREEYTSGKIITFNVFIDNPQFPRLALLLQDVEIQQQYPEVLFQEYKAYEQDNQSALSALLLARIQADRESQLQWVDVSLTRDPNFVLAKVFLFGTRADAGDPKLLPEIVELLEDNPGCAEAWRLLAQLAPLYSREDLAAAAAQTEPWERGESSVQSALHSKAVTALRSKQPQKSIAVAEGIEDEILHLLISAAAMAQQQRPAAALVLINTILEEHPRHEVALFNRAILLRDYLGRSEDAAPDLRLFLDITADMPEKFIFRRTQAEYWLLK